MLTDVKWYLYFEVACLDLLWSQQRIATKNRILGCYRSPIHPGLQGQGTCPANLSVGSCLCALGPCPHERMDLTQYDR